MKTLAVWISLLFLVSAPMCSAQIAFTPQRPDTIFADTVKVGIALSGGAAKGFAHLGVLQALDEAGVRIDVVSGTSMGAIMGMFYCAGYSPREILAIAKKEHMDDRKTILRNNHKRDAGYADYRHLRRVFYKYVPHNSFDSLSTKFYCCAVDINNACAKHVGEGGYLAQYVTASAAFPVVFAPVVIEGVTYVDGGVMVNLPVEPLIWEGCDIRIGSYFGDESHIDKFNNRKEIWMRSFSLLITANTVDRVLFCTHPVKIDPHGYSQIDFEQIDNWFQYGYEAGQKLLADHPELRQHTRLLKNPIIDHKAPLDKLLRRLDFNRKLIDRFSFRKNNHNEE